MSVRIYDLSKELAVENKAILDFIRTNFPKYQVKSSSSTIDVPMADHLRKEFRSMMPAVVPPVVVTPAVEPVEAIPVEPPPAATIPEPIKIKVSPPAMDRVPAVEPQPPSPAPSVGAIMELPPAPSGSAPPSLAPPPVTIVPPPPGSGSSRQPPPVGLKGSAPPAAIIRTRAQIDEDRALREAAAQPRPPVMHTPPKPLVPIPGKLGAAVIAPPPVAAPAVQKPPQRHFPGGHPTARHGAPAARHPSGSPTSVKPPPPPPRTEAKVAPAPPLSPPAMVPPARSQVPPASPPARRSPAAAPPPAPLPASPPPARSEATVATPGATPPPTVSGQAPAAEGITVGNAPTSVAPPPSTARSPTPSGSTMPPALPPRGIGAKPPSPPPAAPLTVVPPVAPGSAVGENTGEKIQGPALQVKPPIVVRDFATLLGLKPFKLISELMDLNIFASLNQVIEPEVAFKLAQKHGFTLEIRHRGDLQPESKPKPKPVEEVKIQLEPRPPVVCILGHVDHGKTTLLDTIRNTKVAAGEAGGITQHIGAYQIEHKDHKITFIDTPGHAAFSNMRARGANTTDIAILVVAADDGFMPQTDEALSHARRAKVPVVVAVNKMDARGANLDRVKQQMQERDLAPEDWGGETLCVPVSALKGTGIETLLESLLLQAEIMETIQADPRAPVEGVVLEAQKEIGRGSTASVIVQQGTLKVGDALLCGPAFCKIRQLIDDKGKALKSALPSTPVKVVGWSMTPEAGTPFTVCKNEKEARLLAEENLLQFKKQEAATARAAERSMTAMELLSKISETRMKMFNVLVKADAYGVAEALATSLLLIRSDKIKLEVVDTGVGAISQNDILMASASQASIVAFDVGLEPGVAAFAKHHGIVVYHHNIIYELITIVKEAMAEQLEPELREAKIGQAEVRQLFPLAKGFVAGCLVTEGRIVRDHKARLLRKNQVIHESPVSTLRRFKDDVTEVRAGFECGIRLGNCDAYQIGDVIECMEVQRIKPSL